MRGQDPLDLALTTLHDHPGQPAGQHVGPLHWPSLTTEERDAALTDLDLWVTALTRRFDIDTRTIPPCWARHNPLLEALSALRDHERGSYALQSSPTAAVDWLRALHDVLGFCRDHAARTPCTPHEHRDPLPRRAARLHDR